MRRLLAMLWPLAAVALFLLALTGAGRIGVDTGGMTISAGNALYCELTGCTFTGGIKQPYTRISAAGPTALNGHHTIDCDTSGNDVTLTIPLAASNGGRTYVIGKSAAANDCILAPSGADTFAGELSAYTLQTLQESVILTADGTATWWIVDGASHGNLGAVAQSHTPSGAAAYYRFTSTDSDVAHQMTYSAAEDELTIGWSGEYSIGLTASFSGASGDTFQFCVYAGADGAETCQPKCFFSRKMGPAGDVGSGAAGCHVDLVAGDRVWLGIQSDDTTAVTIDSLNLRVSRTG